MRLAIFSDLHVEFGQSWSPPNGLDYDVLVLAGDVAKHTRGVEQFSRWHKPVIYVAGNHEFYGAEFSELLSALRRASSGSPAEPWKGGVFFLECDEIVIDEVRFLGATLWTDYAVGGRGMRDRAMRLAGALMNDHRLIRAAGAARFTPANALQVHMKSRAWLEAKLSEPFDGETVVVSHHLPHPQSVAPRHQGDALNAAFASDLSSLIASYQPTLWVHGHTHVACDYRIGRTRVICNPRGYPREGGTGFVPHLVVTLDRQ